MTASETTIRDLPASQASMPTVEQDVLVLPGVFEWGPLGAVKVADFDDFVKKYGPGKCFLANYYNAALLQQWFKAKRPAILIRIMHWNGSGLPATGAKGTYMAQTGATAPTKGSVTGTVAAPYAIVTGDTLIGKVDGLAEQTLTLTAVSGTVQNGSDEVFALADAQTLTIKINGGAVQTVIFNTAEFADIGNATAEEVAAVIAAELVGASVTVTGAGKRVTITSDRKGITSSVQVTGGTANAALNFDLLEHTGAAGSNVNNADSVAISELKTLLEAAWTNGGGVTVTDSSGYIKIEADTAGAAGSVQCVATSTADTKLGIDNAVHAGFDGTAVNTLKIDGKYYGALPITYDIAAATDGNAEHFDVKVYVYGLLKESFPNLTMDATSPQYAQTIINSTSGGGSELIAVTDQAAGGTTLQRRPANATGVALAGGNDGLTALTDTDYSGSETYGTGLYALDSIPRQGDIVCCPDRATVALQNLAFDIVEDHFAGMMHFIPDPPASSNSAGIIAHTGSLNATDFASAMPWPRVKMANPSQEVYGAEDTITVPPSVLIATRMALNSVKYRDSIAHQPGNEQHGVLPGAVGLEGADKHEVLKISKRRYVTPYRVNPIIEGRTSTGAWAVWLNDVQVMKTGPTSLWTSIGSSRHVAHVRRVVVAYMETRRTQPNTVDSRQDDKDAIEGYLLGWCGPDRGVFASSKPSEAFYVNTDPPGKTINNPVEQRAQKYHVVIGLAYAEPARFIDVGFTRDDRAVTSYIQSQMALG